MAGKFEVPKDPEVRITAGITLGCVALLIVISRFFHDVNAS